MVSVSAGASSAYLTVSEIFPQEVRAKAIAVFFAIAQCFGALGPVIYGALIGTGESRGPLFFGYLLGAAERGASQTDGIHAELIRRLTSAARYSPDNRPPSADFLRVYREGFDAGEARG